jgi:hypothetical protein
MVLFVRKSKCGVIAHSSSLAISALQGFKAIFNIRFNAQLNKLQNGIKSFLAVDF